MKSRQTLTTVALMVLSFTVTFAVLRHPSVAPPPVAAVPRSSLRTAALPEQRARPAAVAARVAPVAPAESLSPKPAPVRAPAPEPAPEVPTWDDGGPPLPIMFAVSSHPAWHREDAEDDGAGDGDPQPTGQPGVARQVDVLNESSDPLVITVLAVNVPTQETTQTELFVPPHAQAHAGSESGLKLDEGYQVTLRSRGYQQMTQTVP
jgi:hypothetical protein